jgi:hypothetical protein
MELTLCRFVSVRIAVFQDEILHFVQDATFTSVILSNAKNLVLSTQPIPECIMKLHAVENRGIPPFWRTLR